MVYRTAAQNAIMSKMPDDTARAFRPGTSAPCADRARRHELARQEQKSCRYHQGETGQIITLAGVGTATQIPGRFQMARGRSG